MVESTPKYRDRLRRMSLEEIKNELVYLKGKCPTKDTLPKEHSIAWELVNRLTL